MSYVIQAKQGWSEANLDIYDNNCHEKTPPVQLGTPLPSTVGTSTVGTATVAVDSSERKGEATRAMRSIVSCLVREEKR